MSKIQDRKNIVKQIEIAADLYKQYLVGKQFLYVFDNRYIEVIYKSENFRHLTGVETNLSAKRFYNYAKNHILSDKQIWFSSVHPYDLCVRKVQHIAQIPLMASSESFMLEEIKTHTQSYKFGTTDLSFTLCMNKETDKDGNPKGTCYVVQSLRDEDCFSKSDNVYLVTHIFSKYNDQKEYTELIYEDSNSKITDVPEDVLRKLSKAIIKE